MNFDDVMKDNYQYIYNFAMKLTCHPQNAEDVTQETFLQAYKSFSQLRDEQAIKKWLRTICYHCFLIECRKNNRQPVNYVENIGELETEGKVISSKMPEPEEEVLVEEGIRELQNGCFYAMVRRLTLNQRIVFSLMDMFGLSLNEVAEMVQLSENATKALLHRARKNLDAFFSDHCNLIKTNNPCSCKAWIDFRKTYEDNHEIAEEQKMPLDGKNGNDIYDEKVREKIYFLYKNMPEAKPDPKWFQTITKTLSDKSQ